jgi:hypothetical protein
LRRAKVSFVSGEFKLRVLKILLAAALVAATAHVGSASAAPSEAAVLARIDRYCTDPAPQAVAAKVAANGHGQDDPDGLAKMNRPLPAGAKHVAARAWTMRESDTWWLRVGVAQFPNGPMTECTVRVADLREAEMERLLRDGSRWNFMRESMREDYTWVREYRAKTGGGLLLYSKKTIGPPSVRRFHTFSLMSGSAVRTGPKP